jgi:hypothetical protein
MKKLLKRKTGTEKPVEIEIVEKKPVPTPREQVVESLATGEKNLNDLVVETTLTRREIQRELDSLMRDELLNLNEKGEITFFTLRSNSTEQGVYSNEFLRERVLQVLTEVESCTILAISNEIDFEPLQVRKVVLELVNEKKISADGEHPTAYSIKTKPVTAETLTTDPKFVPQIERRQIVDSIGKGCNLVRAIAETTEIDVDKVANHLEFLENEKESEISVVRQHEYLPNFTAYFLAGKAPIGRLALDGHGGVAVVEIPQPTVSAEVRERLQKELDLKNASAAESKTVEIVKNTNNGESQPIRSGETTEKAQPKKTESPAKVEAVQTPPKPKREFGKKIEFDYDVIEQLAFEGVKRTDLHERLGVSSFTTYKRYLDDTLFREAWIRGLNRRPEVVKDANKVITSRSKREFDLAEIEELIFEGKTHRQIAEKYGITSDNFAKYLQRNSDLREACDRGVKRRSENGNTRGYEIQSETASPESTEPKVDTLDVSSWFGQPNCKVEIDPRFEHTLEHLSKNGQSRESFESVKTKLLATEPVFNNQINDQKATTRALDNFDLESFEEDVKLDKRIYAELAYVVAFNEASPHAEATLEMLKARR